jgi:hypothetical protein
MGKNLSSQEAPRPGGQLGSAIRAGKLQGLGTGGAEGAFFSANKGEAVLRKRSVAGLAMGFHLQRHRGEKMTRSSPELAGAGRSRRESVVSLEDDLFFVPAEAGEQFAIGFHH